MYARVARWEGGDGDALRSFAAEVNADPQGPPEGVPARGFMMLMDPERGTSVSIVLFETEEDLRTGDKALDAMTPRTAGTGERASVETYEVGIDLRV
jgi:hypothetical protein